MRPGRWWRARSGRPLDALFNVFAYCDMDGAGMDYDPVSDVQRWEHGIGPFTAIEREIEALNDLWLRVGVCACFAPRSSIAADLVALDNELSAWIAAQIERAFGKHLRFTRVSGSVRTTGPQARRL